MGENNFIGCGIWKNYMWNCRHDFRTNSTHKNTLEVRDFAASEWEVTGLGIEQCSEMGCVISCGGETGEDMETEAGGRTARQTDNNIFATIKRARHYR